MTTPDDDRELDRQRRDAAPGPLAWHASDFAAVGVEGGAVRRQALRQARLDGNLEARREELGS